MKTNDQIPTQESALNAPENIRGYKQTSTVNSDEDNNQNHMNTQNGSPVTESLSEQATAYAAASENDNSVTNNLKVENIMTQSDLNTASENIVDNASVDVQSSAEQQGTISTSSNCPVPFDKCLGGKYIAGTKAGTIVPNPNLKVWDGEPLKEDVVYHRNKMLGLPECTIMENRDALKRANDWQEICRENGMTNSALYVSAKTVKDAGLTPAIYQRDTKKWWIVPDDLLRKYYSRWDANGRGAGHDLDLDKATVDPDYTPFDFTFTFKTFESPEQFFKQYISTNLDVKKTTRSELLRYASCRNAGSILNSYYAMQTDGFVAKAASLYTFGRELTKDDIKNASAGKDINVDNDLVDSLRELLDTYINVFSGDASQKVLKGVAIARWTRDTLKNAKDMKTMADKIKNKFAKMLPEQLSKLQDAKGVKGDRTKTTEIILIGIFNEILNS